jgi:hypothetical protein
MSILKLASLIVTANAYEESKLLAVVPSNGSGDLDFVRASTKTRVNPQGFIEDLPYNLADYSEEFNNISWTKANCEVTSLNNVSPIGTASAEEIRFLARYGRIIKENIIPNGTITISMYIKNVNGNSQLNLRAGNLGSIYDSPITITNEWVRYSATFTYNGTDALGISLQDRNEAGFGRCLIWGAQIDRGSVLKPYYPTTNRLNVPSIDYTDGGCPSILLEPQRTNLNTNYLLSDWSTQLTKTISYGISPDGTQNSTRLLNESGSNQGISKNYTLTSGFKYSFSFYLKKNSGDLSNGAGKCFIYPQSPSVSIDFSDSTNEWKKYSITFTSSTTGAVTFQIRTDRVSDIEVYGVQLEEGSYVTSIIPTQASAVTRLQDQLRKTGIGNLIGQTEGVVFAECLFFNNTVQPSSITISSGSTTNRICFRRATNGSLTVVIVSSGIVQIVASTISVNINEFYKIGLNYQSNTVKLFLNGALIYENNNIQMPINLNTLTFSIGDETSDFFQGKINSLVLFKSYLSDDEMQLLGTTSYNTYQEMATALNYVTQ